MTKIKTLYQQLWQYYRQHWLRLHWGSMAAYVLAMLAAVSIAGQRVRSEAFTELKQAALEQASAEAELAGESISSEALAAVQREAEQTTWRNLWWHNSISDLLSILFGLVPGLFVPAWLLVMNAVDWGGTLVAVAALMDIPVGQFFLGTYAGHAIYEAIVNTAAYALGLYLCYLTTKQLLRRNPAGLWRENALKTVQFYLLVIIPNLLICGLLEDYFTGWLSSLVLGPLGS